MFNSYGFTREYGHCKCSRTSRGQSLRVTVFLSAALLPNNYYNIYPVIPCDPENAPPIITNKNYYIAGHLISLLILIIRQNKVDLILTTLW